MDYKKKNTLKCRSKKFVLFKRIYSWVRNKTKCFVLFVFGFGERKKTNLLTTSGRGFFIWGRSSQKSFHRTQCLGNINQYLVVCNLYSN